jgi:hypothetical protein
MAEKNEDMGAVTHQLSTVDDDMQQKTIKETNVASVALGTLSLLPLKQQC